MVSFFFETLTTRTHPEILAGIWAGYGKAAFGAQSHNISERQQYMTNVTIVPHALSIGAKINDIR